MKTRGVTGSRRENRRTGEGPSVASFSATKPEDEAVSASGSSPRAAERVASVEINAAHAAVAAESGELDTARAVQNIIRRLGRVVFAVRDSIIDLHGDWIATEAGSHVYNELSFMGDRLIRFEYPVSRETLGG